MRVEGPGLILEECIWNN